MTAVEGRCKKLKYTKTERCKEKKEKERIMMLVGLEKNN